VQVIVRTETDRNAAILPRALVYPVFSQMPGKDPVEPEILYSFFPGLYDVSDRVNKSVLIRMD
jgi:hypothetical protein